MAGSGPEGGPLMRTYYDVRLNDRTITKRELTGEAIVKAGRYLIAKTLLELDVATVDPVSPLNPLIFSAGPFAGTSWSNANRTSVGCKSPLTGGVKEANGGGTFSYGLGQLKIAGLTLHGASPSWVVLHVKKGGDVDFDDAAPYLGKGNFEAQALLHARYGKKVTIALCGPVGEYQGLIAGIAFSDKDGRPARLSARGGVGAVMGSKKVKAIVVDLDKIPPFEDAKKVNAAIKDYAKMLLADSIVTNFYAKIGTMGMADLQNTLGGLPVRNFSAGQLVNVSTGETFKMGGEYISQLNVSRGGEHTHACMPGCVIQCSNAYADANGKEGAGRGRGPHGRQPPAVKDGGEGDGRDRRAELGAPGPRGRQRFARALHLRHERDEPQHRVPSQRHQRGARDRADEGLLRAAR